MLLRRNPRLDRVALALVVILALAVRLGALVATHGLPLAADPADYSRHARSIAAGHAYPSSGVVPGGGPTAIRPPGFPFVLAGVYKLTGNSVTAGRVAQALLGAAIVGLIALIAFELWGMAVAVGAGVLAAVFPPLVIDGMNLLSEPLFVVLELSAIFSVLRWRRSRAVPWLIAAGALSGLALLTRANGWVLLLPLVVAARSPSPWRVLRSYRPSVLLVGCALLVVLPWTIRNAVELHAFIPISDQDGYTLAGTYNATSRAHNATWIVATKDPAMARLYARYAPQGEVALDNKLRAEARRFVLKHPGYLFTVAFHNTLRMFNLGGATFERNVASGDYHLGRRWAQLMTYGLFPFLVFACAGALTRAARQAHAWFWAIPALMLVPIMVLANNRARAPIDPFLLMLAALPVIAAWRRSQAPSARQRTVA